MDHMQSHGIDQKELLAAAIEANWVWTGTHAGSVKNVLTQALDPKVLRPEETYKGDGNLCFSLVFLLSYYAQKFVDRRGEDAHTQSFYALHLICRELRHLQAKEPLSGSVTEVTRLAKLQSLHQQKFCQAYGEEWCRPKHHYRMHLPIAIMGLRAVPRCNPQERKHGVLKGRQHLLDKMNHSVNRSFELQESLLPRMLLASAPANQASFLKATLSGRTKKAAKDIAVFFGDPHLKAAKQAHVGTNPISVGNVVLWDCRAGQVEDLVGGESTPVHIRMKMYSKEAEHSFGTEWNSSDERIWHRPRDDESFLLAVWWRKTQKGLLCLH